MSSMSLLVLFGIGVVILVGILFVALVIFGIILLIKKSSKKSNSSTTVVESTATEYYDSAE